MASEIKELSKTFIEKAKVFLAKSSLNPILFFILIFLILYRLNIRFIDFSAALPFFLILIGLSLIMAFSIKIIGRNHFNRGFKHFKNNLEIYLNTSMLILIIFTGLSIFTYNITYEEPELNYNDLNLNPSYSKEPPDIYYIIPDRYARNDVLKKQYSFNNSNFTDSLERKGFHITDKSYANYPNSYLSIATTLNMKYAQDIGFSKELPEKELYPAIENNQVQSFLRSQDYKYYHIGNYYLPTSQNKNADSNHNKYPNLYQKIYLENSSNSLIDNPESGYISPQFTPLERRKATLSNFEELKNISEQDDRKFVFAHILMPHVPFEFGPDGEKIDYKGNTSREEKYLNQLQATNKYLNQTVDHILENEDNNTVIIIQSDEGPYTKNRYVKTNYYNWDWKGKSPEKKRKRAGILNAVYAPGLNDKKLYDKITPVNNFRVIFNHYFNTDMSLLEDKTYLKTGRKGHGFIKLNQTTLYPTES